MKISIGADVSETHHIYRLELSELELTEKEWKKLSEKEQQNLLQGWLNDLPEQPYWVINTFKEI